MAAAPWRFRAKVVLVGDGSLVISTDDGSRLHLAVTHNSKISENELGIPAGSLKEGDSIEVSVEQISDGTLIVLDARRLKRTDVTVIPVREMPSPALPVMASAPAPGSTLSESRRKRDARPTGPVQFPSDPEFDLVDRAANFVEDFSDHLP